MDKSEVLARLAQDKPLFHYVDETGMRHVAQAGITIGVGEISWGIGPRVLRWIADHLTGDMITLETGAGFSTVLFAALGRDHYCCSFRRRETDKIRDYLEQIGISPEKVTFIHGSSDETLPQLEIGKIVDFAYVDGCHGYPFPALDWHYIDKHLKIDGVLGMDNVELRPVREHCEFLEENEVYRLEATVIDGYFVRFYVKQADQQREWVDQRYSRAKRDPCDWRLSTRIRRKLSKFLKPHPY
jgi:Methyltransferase domain